MDKIIRNIEWYAYSKSPRHTAFREYRVISFFAHIPRWNRFDRTEQLQSDLIRKLIKLLNAVIFGTADFISFVYKISCFLFVKFSFVKCRSPPIQNFSNKF